MTRTHHACKQFIDCFERLIINKDVTLGIIDHTPINLGDYFITFLITLAGAFVGGWIAFLFNRKQEQKKQESDDRVERIKHIYVPLCTAIEKLMTDAYGRDTGDYEEPSIFVLATKKWRNYQKSLRSLFLAQTRRLMLKNELEEIKQFYELTESLNNLYEEAFYSMMTSYESSNEEKCLSRKDAIRDIACYSGTLFGTLPACNQAEYLEAVKEYAPLINNRFVEYIRSTERIYTAYLEKIGVADMSLDISLFEKTKK